MLQPGANAHITFIVTTELTARAVGSGTLDVLATPVMIARMEEAAWTAVAPLLPQDSGTVGVHLDVKHLSPSPLGMNVTCRAELIEADGKRLVFRVSASDERGPIGEGIHSRAVIQEDSFLKKAQGKLDAPSNDGDRS